MRISKRAAKKIIKEHGKDPKDLLNRHFSKREQRRLRFSIQETRPVIIYCSKQSHNGKLGFKWTKLLRADNNNRQGNWTWANLVGNV